MAHLFQRQMPGGLVLTCSICRVSAAVRDSLTGEQFLRAHAHVVQPVDPRYYGAGDAVAGVTGALGIAQCAPCQERQQFLNRVLPRLWRR